MLKNDYKEIISYIQNQYMCDLSQATDVYITYGLTLGSWIYILGESFKALPCHKCKWHVRVLAQRGNPTAQLALGFDYGSYSYMSRQTHSIKENIEWLKCAGNLGETNAYWVLGTISMHFGMKTTAIEWYKKGAESGDTACMCTLGATALTKLMNAEIALPWFEQAASAGEELACRYCAYIYGNCIGAHSSNNVKSNPRLCIEYLKKSNALLSKNKPPNYDKIIDENNKLIEKQKLKIED